MKRFKVIGLSAVALVVLLVSSTVFAAIPLDFQQFESTIPDVTVQMLYPDFWVDKPGQAKQVIMDEEEIAEYNARLLEDVPRLMDLEEHPDSLTGEELTALIEEVSVRPGRRYDADGNRLTDEYLDNLEANLNLDGIEDVNPVQYGITVRRTNLRVFPTNEPAYSSQSSLSDRFQWTAVYAAEPLVVLHTSVDGEWYFARIYTCFAWIPAADVALTETKDELFDYVHRQPFLVVTGDRVYTQYSTETPGVSALQLDMGVRVPLATPEEIGDEVDGQLPAGNVVVILPTRDEDGYVDFEPALISRLADVNIGYLSYTQENIIRQAFKMQGQHYGWGGTFNARDCSAFLMDVFKSMGLMLPRNSTEQGDQATGVWYPIPEADDGQPQDQSILDEVDAGAMLWMSGHVMLYLGMYDGAHYMIHDSGYATGVAVTPTSIYRTLRGARQYVIPYEGNGQGNHWGK